MTTSYKDAGVHIDTAHHILHSAKDAITSTHTQDVLHHPAAFAGLFALNDLPNQPVLVASTDGVGTKTQLALRYNAPHNLGLDLVHHCVNDLLASRAKPLFLLNYIAAAQLDHTTHTTVLKSIARACSNLPFPLPILGGESAEMPGTYTPHGLDLVATLLGITSKDTLNTLPTPRSGDVILGLASSGPHTNGYSLIRHITHHLDLTTPIPSLSPKPPIDLLLTPHRCYAQDLDALQRANIPITSISHITGGGLVDNPHRPLPQHLHPHIDTSSWPTPPLFDWLQTLGDIDTTEMMRVFNMGLGLLITVHPNDADRALHTLTTPAWIVGELRTHHNTPPHTHLKL